MSSSFPVALLFDKRDRCNLSDNNVRLTDTPGTFHFLKWHQLNILDGWVGSIVKPLLKDGLLFQTKWGLWHSEQYTFSPRLHAFAKEFFRSLSYTIHRARNPSYSVLQALSLFPSIKLSRVDISICHFYQEIGPKLRKFWTQYSYKINNKMSFIIISKHISPLIVHFIGCK